MRRRRDRMFVEDGKHKDLILVRRESGGRTSADPQTNNMGWPLLSAHDPLHGPYHEENPANSRATASHVATSRIKLRRHGSSSFHLGFLIDDGLLDGPADIAEIGGEATPPPATSSIHGGDHHMMDGGEEIGFFYHAPPSSQSGIPTQHYVDTQGTNQHGASDRMSHQHLASSGGASNNINDDMSHHHHPHHLQRNDDHRHHVSQLRAPRLRTYLSAQGLTFGQFPPKSQSPMMVQDHQHHHHQEQHLQHHTGHFYEDHTSQHRQQNVHSASQSGKNAQLLQHHQQPLDHTHDYSRPLQSLASVEMDRRIEQQHPRPPIDHSAHEHTRHLDSSVMQHVKNEHTPHSLEAQRGPASLRSTTSPSNMNNNNNASSNDSIRQPSPRIAARNQSHELSGASTTTSSDIVATTATSHGADVPAPPTSRLASLEASSDGPRRTSSKRSRYDYDAASEPPGSPESARSAPNGNSSKKRRRRWLNFEDELLRDNVQSFLDSHKPADENSKVKIPWNKIAQLIPNRNAKQCRDRWQAMRNPNNKREWTMEDDLCLLRLQKRFSNRWVRIAAAFPDRNDNMVKSRFRVLSKLNITPEHIAAQIDRCNATKQARRSSSTAADAHYYHPSQVQQQQQQQSYQQALHPSVSSMPPPVPHSHSASSSISSSSSSSPTWTSPPAVANATNVSVTEMSPASRPPIVEHRTGASARNAPSHHHSQQQQQHSHHHNGHPVEKGAMRPPMLPSQQHQQGHQRTQQQQQQPPRETDLAEWCSILLD